MSHTYCHTHSAYDCQTCADEILSLGIQADKDRIAALERELERLRECKVLLSESRKAMLQYDADYDEYPPYHHNKLMKRINAALAQGKGE